MPIQENALNAVLADALTAYDLHATPEQTNARSGAKRCDVQIRRKHGDRYFTALECKIGHDVPQRKDAVKDAQRWLKQSDCWNAVALCYPQELSEDSQKTSRQRLETTKDLLMVRVSHGDATGHWHSGGLAELAKLSDDIGANETYAITDILQRAILTASELIDAATGKDLATALELPWDPGKGRQIDPRPARIACLIVANMALLQNRMHSEGVRIPDLEPLIAIRSDQHKQVALLDNWQRIRDVDYAPVVDPALAVLHTLPSDHHTDSSLEILIGAVLECVPRIRGLQLDHAGPLYHGLLQTARYDGSFYTSTAAAVLLAELAMPLNWLSSESDWADADKLTDLKICDPACGTGTLLMAAARTIQERYRATGGNADDLEALHLGLIEDTLHGLDINRHGALEAVDGILSEADSGTLSAAEAIEQLLNAQILLRNNRRLQTAMRASRLPAVKTLDQFDFAFQPSIKREQIESLHELGFLDRGENVIYLGPPGVGKTHLAISLAIAAAQSGRRVYYGTLAGLIESLTEAKAAGNLSRRLRVLTHPALLVVDEIGYLPVNQDGAVLFFQLINARHERASTVLTSNKGFEDWGGVLGDEVMAAALIDRLVHHCHIVNIRGNSYRMRDHQNLLQAGSDRRRKRGAS